MKPLAKIKQDKMLAGICSGFAYSVGVPAWVMRILAVVLAMASGVGVVAYLLLWVFMPQWRMDPTDYVERTRIEPAAPV
jgi:phage shock protein PspC (stress-responsive transcriptional regulator)